MNLMTHSKCMDVIVEPVMGYLDHIAMATSYGVLKPGMGKIDVCLRNHSADNVSKVGCCGRNHSSKHHSGSIGTKACRA